MGDLVIWAPGKHKQLCVWGSADALCGLRRWGEYVVLSFPSALSPVPPPGAACRGRRLGRDCVGDSESERNGRFGVDAFVC